MNAIIQPMPKLRADELDALRSDIAANGVMVPVVKDQHGRILDGNHRAAIATELGIDYPAVTVTVTDDDDAWDKAVTFNCARRHMTREQVREVIRSEILRRPYPGESDRAIARRVGCSPTTVGSVRAEIKDAKHLTKRVQTAIDEFLGHLVKGVIYGHAAGLGNWQEMGDWAERYLRSALTEKLQTQPVMADDEMWDSLEKHVWAPFINEIRAMKCDSACEVCNVSNLDSTEAVGS